MIEMGKVIVFSEEPGERTKKETLTILNRILKLIDSEMATRPEEVRQAIDAIPEEDKDRMLFYGASLYCLRKQFFDELFGEEAEE